MHNPAMEVTLKLFLLLIVVLYASFAAIVHLIADRMIFLPPRSSYGPGDLPVTMVPAAAGAHLAVLHLPRADASFTILYSHGNAEDLGHLAELLEAFRTIGFSVLAYDYRGYGLSTGGPPTAKGATRDLQDVYEYAVSELGIPAERLILLGRSVGSGPATEVAAREHVGGLVLESGFISAFRVVTGIQLLPFDRFPNLAHIRSVEAPVLVIHGTHDEVIPISHGRRLYEAAPGPKQALWVEGAGHNDLVWRAGERYFNALREFATLIERHGSEGQSGAVDATGSVSPLPPGNAPARTGDLRDEG